MVSMLESEPYMSSSSKDLASEDGLSRGSEIMTGEVRMVRCAPHFRCWCCDAGSDRSPWVVDACIGVGDTCEDVRLRLKLREGMVCIV
jgi:hypothetical protein